MSRLPNMSRWRCCTYPLLGVIETESDPALDFVVRVKGELGKNWGMRVSSSIQGRGKRCGGGAKGEGGLYR